MTEHTGTPFGCPAAGWHVKASAGLATVRPGSDDDSPPKRALGIGRQITFAPVRLVTRSVILKSENLGARVMEILFSAPAIPLLWPISS